jgi:hypothetical protein
MGTIVVAQLKCTSVLEYGMTQPNPEAHAPEVVYIAMTLVTGTTHSHKY